MTLLRLGRGITTGSAPDNPDQRSFVFVFVFVFVYILIFVFVFVLATKVDPDQERGKPQAVLRMILIRGHSREHCLGFLSQPPSTSAVGSQRTVHIYTHRQTHKHTQIQKHKYIFTNTKRHMPPLTSNG